MPWHEAKPRRSSSVGPQPCRAGFFCTHSRGSAWPRHSPSLRNSPHKTRSKCRIATNKCRIDMKTGLNREICSALVSVHPPEQPVASDELRGGDSMFNQINGLPAHVLINHAAVVLTPL